MTEEEIQSIMNYYRLTDEQVAQVTNSVIQCLAYQKKPAEKPLAIIVGGQSGSGKTALINYTSTMSPERDFITIDNDFFRAFHPKADEIKQFYPELYTHATDQIGLGITSDIISYFMGNNPDNIKYDLIFHQTLKNNRIADDAMTKLKDAGYTVIARAFAVPYFESKISQIERCKAQYQAMNFCRHVRKVDHDAAMAGIPGTVDYIETNKKCDLIEIFKRGEKINEPKVVYAKFNEDTKEETLKALQGCTTVSFEDNTKRFSSAKEAMIETRKQETIKCAKTLRERIDAIKADGGYEIPGMAEHIDELEEEFKKFLESQSLN